MNMGAPPKFLHLPSTEQEKRSYLIGLRKDVTPVLATNLLPHFTDHSVDHSDQMVEIVDSLIEPLQCTGKKLTAQELTILYSACYFY